MVFPGHATGDPEMEAGVETVPLTQLQIVFTVFPHAFLPNIHILYPDPFGTPKVMVTEGADVA